MRAGRACVESCGMCVGGHVDSVWVVYSMCAVCVGCVHREYKLQPLSINTYTGIVVYKTHTKHNSITGSWVSMITRYACLKN